MTRATGALVCVIALLACKMGQQQNSAAGDASAAASAAAPQAASEVSFSKRVPRSGTQSSGTRDITTKVVMNGKVSRERNVLDASLSVQASDEFRITRAAIDVRELYTVSQEGTGTEKKSVSPLAGSRYVVSRSDDGKLSALDSAGAQVAAAQLKLLKDEFGNVFERSTVGEFLPERPVKLGEKLVPPSDAVIKMLGLKDDGKTLFDGIEFILGKVDGGVASFDVTMTMTQRLDAGLRLRAKLKGQIDLKTDGTWLTRVDLKGPIEVLDGSGATKATGELSANLKETFQ